jgi:diacylglycerol kinase (ATP)
MTVKNPLKWNIKRLAASFRHAGEGVMDAFRTQKHMRVHFMVIILVAVLSCFLDLKPAEVAILITCTSLVVMAELINTAVESILNLIVQTYHPGAKFAKDVAAGAVLIAALNATVVSIYIFFHGTNWTPWPEGPGSGEKVGVVHLTAVSLVLVLVLIVISKVWRRPGSVLRGGRISGHTALAFCLSTCLFFLSRNLLVTLIGMALAGMVAQSRLEGGNQTWRGLLYGTLLGILTTLLIFVGVQSGWGGGGR